MAGENSGSPDDDRVIRKLVGDRPTPLLPLHRAFRLTLGEVADNTFGIELDVRGIEDRVITQKEAITTSLDGGAYFSTRGPNDGPGMAIASQEVVTSLIEIQTVGGVMDTPLPDRLPTRIDSAIAESFIDAVMEKLGSMMGNVAGEEWIREHRVNAPLFEMHRLALDLPDIAYRTLRATLGFGNDKRVGDIVFILPRDPVQKGATDLGKQASAAISDWKDRLQTAVEGTRATLRATLHRQQMGLNEIKSLQAGSQVPLPAGAHSRILLEGIDGHPVAVGKIGMVNGMKAIWITGFDLSAPAEDDRTGADETGGFPAIEDPMNDIAAMPGLGDDFAIEPMATQLPDLDDPGNDAVPVAMNLAAIGEDDTFEDLPELEIASLSA